MQVNMITSPAQQWSSQCAVEVRTINMTCQLHIVFFHPHKGTLEGTMDFPLEETLDDDTPPNLKGSH